MPSAGSSRSAFPKTAFDSCRLRRNANSPQDGFRAAIWNGGSQTYRPLHRSSPPQRPCIAVVSFNYDTLVERALQQLDIVGSTGHLDEDALGRYPGPPYGEGLSVDMPTATVDLIKLHGSI